MPRLPAILIASSLFVFSASSIAGGFDYEKEDMGDYSMQPSFEVKTQSDNNDYARNGKAVYLFAGYMYTDRFLSNSTQTISNGSTSFSYVPKNALPDGFNGFQVGFGKELSYHFDMQLAYLQYLKESKTSTISSYSVTGSTQVNSVMAALGYVINPDSQFQVLVKAGAVIGEYDNSFSIRNSTYYPTQDNTRVDPMGGMDVLFQFTPSIGVRLSADYIADLNNTNSSGEVNGMAGLNFVI